MKVYITRPIPETGIELLKREGLEVFMNPEDRVLAREELLENVKGMDAVITLLTDKVDAVFFEAAGPQLKVVANYAVGYDNIDVAEATRRRIVVTNTPGVLTETTADLAWALIMAVARRIVEAHNYAATGEWKGWGPLQFLGVDVYGKTLGIVGAGRIGQAVARRAMGFEMKVIYYDKVRLPSELEKKLNMEFCPLEELLRRADIISLHSPLTPETYHMIDEKAISMMKPTAIIINTARGPVIDEEALIRALREKRIWGAGLDVFEKEPYIPEELRKLTNVVILPHIGSASHETRNAMSELAARNVVAVLKGHTPPTPVNPEVLQQGGD
ncbi:D-glycerate dehydrogenase [Coprothermobacteraceae bacterium]|nr:D-glycerate dehydrogenase [Coprothermobacteraceae bacterium]